MDQHKAQVILYRQDGCDFSARTPFSLFTSQQTKVKEVEYKLTISAIFPMSKSGPTVIIFVLILDIPFIGRFDEEDSV